MSAVAVPEVCSGKLSSCENDAKPYTNPGMMETDATRSQSGGDAGAPRVTVAWAREDEATVFAMKETIGDQMARLQRTRARNPGEAARIMRRGQILVDLAGAGRLRELDHVVSNCPRDEILTWFSVRMFQAACLHNRLSTMRFMVDRGFDVGFSAVSEALHWLVKGGNAEMNGRDILPAMDFLVKETRMSPNVQRKSDYRTPLHLAVERGFFEAARRLVDLGADVNAVAKDDVMPLSLAEEDIHPLDTVSIDRSNYSGAATTVAASGSEGNEKHKQGPHLDEQSTRKSVDREDHPFPRGKEAPLTSGVDPCDGIQRRKHATEGALSLKGINDPLNDPSVEQKHLREKLQHLAHGENEQRRIAEGRARICGLLVEHGARRTWRRAPSAKQIALDNKYSDLMRDDDGRNLCTFNG